MVDNVMQDAVEQQCVQILIDLFADQSIQIELACLQKTTPYSKKLLQVYFQQFPTIQLLLHYESAVAVLKLIVPAQFTAILEELVMESAATNQAEWVRVKMRK